MKQFLLLLLLLYSCFLLSFSQSDERVKMDVFVMSKCSDVQSLYRNYLSSVMKQLNSIINLNVYFIAKVNPNAKYGFDSAHGDTEVAGDLFEVCAQQFYKPNNTFFNLYMCLNDKQYQIPNQMQDCSSSVGMDFNQLQTCAFGYSGKQLLTNSINVTNAHQVNWSPSIFLNDQFWCRYNDKPCPATTVDGYIQTICKLYKGVNPPMTFWTTFHNAMEMYQIVWRRSCQFFLISRIHFVCQKNNWVSYQKQTKMVLNRVSIFDTNQHLNSIKQDRFTILVFYRGSWCNFCNNYLCSINPMVDKIKRLGGKIVAVCSQNIETVKQTHEDLQLAFPIISDEQNILAKQCKVEITEKKSTLYHKMVQLAKKFKVNTQYLDSETNYTQGISQPAIVVWNSNQNIIFNWKKYPSFQNLYGASERIPIEEVLTVVEYQLSPSYAVVSSKIRVKLDSHRELFESILADPKLKKKLEEHLKKERTYELLEFVEQIEEWELLEEEKKDKKKWDIYNQFLMEQSAKEVNLPFEIKSKICEYFEKQVQEDQGKANRRSLSKSFAKLSIQKYDTSYEGLFHEAYSHIKGILFVDSYSRFQATPSFFELATILPQYFIVS